MLTFLKYLLKPHFILVLASIILGIYYPNIIEFYRQYFSATKDGKTVHQPTDEIKLFTQNDLAQFNGENDDKPIYLSILGSVFDVTKGKKHYGKGCTYGFFAGRDASVSFITGEFENYTEDLNDVLQLKPSDLLSLVNWKNFYHQQYTYKGKLIGRFYDETGDKTDYHTQIDHIVRIAEGEKIAEEKRKDEFPPCNIEWSESLGTKVWCSNQSGGKLRDWIGVPRKYFEPGKSSYRCACIKNNHLDSPLIKEYENCDPGADTCFYRVD